MSAFGWRSVFLINIPVVVAGIALTLRSIPDDRGTHQRISPSGHLTLLIVVASTSFVLIQGHSSGFGTPLILGAAGVLTVSAVVLVVQQRRTSRPVMPWLLFRNRAFAIPNLVGFLYSSALYGGLYLMGRSSRTPVRPPRWKQGCNCCR